jgi:RNA polymerase sigma-70 factor, ECF subfamily
VSSHPPCRKSDSEPISAVFARPPLQQSARAALFGVPEAPPRSTGGRAPSPGEPRGEENREAIAHRQTTPHISPAAPVTWLDAYDRGRQTWDTVRIGYGEFEAHVLGLRHGAVPAHAVDLYLAAACRLRRGPALQLLERDFILRARGAIQSVVRETSAVDDILQDVRSRLFAGPASKLACYRGTGPLGSWVRSIALNVARDHLRAEAARRRAEEVQALSFARGTGETSLRPESPARCVLRHGRGPASLDAVRLAFEALGPHERQLLHDHYLRGLSIDILAPLCRVNRATVARRIRRATDEVARQVRKRLAVLYPREDARSLDSLALAVCRDLTADAATLLGVPEAQESAPAAGPEPEACVSAR